MTENKSLYETNPPDILHKMNLIDRQLFEVAQSGVNCLKDHLLRELSWVKDVMEEAQSEIIQLRIENARLKEGDR